MHESDRRPLVRVFEANDALRRELVRAVSRAGFEAESGCSVPSWESLVRDSTPPLAVVALDAPGAAAWIAHPEARRTSLFLARDVSEGDALRLRFGFALELLIKPFSIESLEARLVSQRANASPSNGLVFDPWLETGDAHLARTLERAWHLARQSGAVCIEGELGTGRRALARAIHAKSPRAAEPLVAIEGAGLSERPGDAFERALGDRIRAAGDGSLLIVEPGEWPLRVQLGLRRELRAVSDRAGPRCLTLSAMPLEGLARDGRLEVELHYQLSGATLRMPPLRARRADWEMLLQSTARRLAREQGRPTPPLDPALLADLARAGFPGNRLGLEHRLRQTFLGAHPPAADLDPDRAPHARPGESRASDSFDLRVLERETISRALEHANGNRTHASRALGISVRTLRNKLREYALR